MTKILNPRVGSSFIDTMLTNSNLPLDSQYNPSLLRKWRRDFNYAHVRGLNSHFTPLVEPTALISSCNGEYLITPKGIMNCAYEPKRNIVSSLLETTRSKIRVRTFRDYAKLARLDEDVFNLLENTTHGLGLLVKVEEYGKTSEGFYDTVSPLLIIPGISNKEPSLVNLHNSWRVSYDV